MFLEKQPLQGSSGAARARIEVDRGYAVRALVLQGGGALGSYQAGVYEGLAEAGIEPNWVAGISIGALNAAIIAGNAPEHRVARLREFWAHICRQPWLPSLFPYETIADSAQHWPDPLRIWFDGIEAARALVEGQRGFFSPRVWRTPGAHSDLSQARSTPGVRNSSSCRRRSASRYCGE